MSPSQPGAPRPGTMAPLITPRNSRPRSRGWALDSIYTTDNWRYQHAFKRITYKGKCIQIGLSRYDLLFSDGMTHLTDDVFTPHSGHVMGDNIFRLRFKLSTKCWGVTMVCIPALILNIYLYYFYFLWRIYRKLYQQK